MSLPTPSKPPHPLHTLRRARSTILHLLLARPTSAPFTLANISRFMSSASGLDKSLMIIQYPAKIVVALLVALVARLGKANVGKDAPLAVGREVLRSWAMRYAVRFKALSSSIGDARTMMRLLGQSHDLDNASDPLSPLAPSRHHPRPRLHSRPPIVRITHRPNIPPHHHPPNRLPHPLLPAREPILPLLQGRLTPLARPRTRLEHMELQVLGRVRCA